MLQADGSDPEAVRESPGRTRSSPRPSAPTSRGAELVAACAEAGTHYLDLTGEPEFVDLTFVRHHPRAPDRRQAGARGRLRLDPLRPGRAVHRRQLPEDVPIHRERVRQRRGDALGRDAGSAIDRFSRPRQTLDAARDRKRHEPRLGRRADAPAGRAPVREVGGWALPLPSLDAQVVGVRRVPWALRARLPLPPLRGREGACRPRWAAAGPSAVVSGCAGAAGTALVGGTGSSRVTGPPRSSGRRTGSRSGSWARAAVGGSSPRSRAATPATARRRRCSASPRSAWPSTTSRYRGPGHHGVRDGRRADRPAAPAGITFRVAASR